MDLLPATVYTGISDRSKDVSAVHDAFDKIKQALPTSIVPDVRETLLRAILEDLRPSDKLLDEQAGGSIDKSGETWRSWPVQVTTSALETVKILGRNPSGSEILATKQYLCVPAFHAGLIAQRDSTEDVSRGRKDAGAWNKARSHAVAIIANALRLFEDPALDAAQDLALGTAAVEILRSVDDDEATFLLGRLLMLLTSRSKSGRKESDGKLMEPYVKRFVEVDDGVELLQKYLTIYSDDAGLGPSSSPFKALALEEVLRLTYHVVALYPDVASMTVDGSAQREAAISLLLSSLLSLLFRLPQQELIPPISYVVNCLGRIPVTQANKAIWRTSPSSKQSVTSRILGLVETYLEKRIPPLHWKPDDAVPRGYGIDGKIPVDEHLPPGLLLLTQLASSDDSWRREIRDRLIPRDLDRSPDSLPLEKRPTILGTLLRFLRSSTHPVTQMTLGEFFWTICGSDATTLSQEIGYGNAAGLLFNKGMPGPPAPPAEEAHIEELPDDDNDASADRNIITALKSDSTASPATTDMTDEEKEREAEKIMSYFDRMERNPAMQMVKNPMKEAVASGRADEWEKKEADEELRRRAQQDEEDEKEALREMAAYKARKQR